MCQAIKKCLITSKPFNASMYDKKFEDFYLKLNIKQLKTNDKIRRSQAYYYKMQISKNTKLDESWTKARQIITKVINHLHGCSEATSYAK